ncbi:pyrrolidone-carboxylate peptidase [Phtheirospermum japonicum]|uniref:Pyrrolidone-carboxylate peptidase n=1 Tax=Phtheirospermum japonicum TaxID=374723 RepID=A0A830B6D6_9LAMI|nr:pyrrolidone-carboxylate peptidase [Phtheirospermum japonicum]
MGSEGPQSVRINVTGFKKFQGVDQNPTEIIVNNLKDYVESLGTPAGVTLGICTVLETAANGAISELYRVLESGISTPTNSDNEIVIWLHLGLNSGLLKFAIERQAVNEATFCCPDELGWQPQQHPIIPADGGISRNRKTSCSVEAIVEFMKMKGFDTTLSYDAGRFVCNFVYYHSLLLAEQKGYKSLFVHLPTFSRVDQETQMQFVVALLEAIASTCLISTALM